MEALPGGLKDIAGAIQLALAPVFLLTGIAGLLNVMAGRLSRIIDRGRALASVDGVPPEALHDLERRRHFTSVAITACTIAALLVCVVIAALFLEVMLGAPFAWLIGVLFTGTMLALVIGLSFFLREVQLSMRSVHARIVGRKKA
ncbi:MAG TPA: DUF2721 domain-containing protein [Candidatus Polarisedimenticolaceae bacterium]|nr:DUF2721 domain-containing protein [Candidatus Polarisedimenticolaceae bacterium]